jgi:endonuclease/exonuclease/phosphatase family metal-dependent hydrolase
MDRFTDITDIEIRSSSLKREARVSKRTVTVASMNLHGGVDSAGRPYDVAAAIRGLDAQVITVQETWTAGSQDPLQVAADAMGADLLPVALSPVTSLSRLGIDTRTGRGRLGMALLSVLPVTGYEVAQLGRAPGDSVPRCAQIVTIKLAHGTVVRFAATHLTHRLLSPAQLWRLTRRLDGDQLPTVIAGDLNMPWRIARLTPGYSAVVQGPTWPAETPLVQLDHVLVSRDIRPVEAAVLAPNGSDHRAVRVKLHVQPSG